MLHAPGLKGFIIFLVVAGIVVPLFHRARIGTVLGFLIAGAALGPQGLGRLAGEHDWLHYITFDDPERGEPLAELGIIVLLFLLGLELSLQRLWQLRRYVLGVGLFQVALSTLAIGLVVRFSGGVPPSGIVLGLCLALSSTAIVMQVLTEQHRAAMPVGRIALSVLLFQDLMVVPILFIVGFLGGGKEMVAGGITALIAPFAQALGAVAVIALIGRFVMPPLLHQAVRTGSRDLIMALALLILVAAALATGLAGLSVALGAFLAGMLLSDSEARHHIEVDLDPFKGLLLGIFFITVGTRLDPVAIAGDAGWIVLGTLVLLAVKAAILFAVARGFGLASGTAAELALLLAQAGEFAFVVIGVAHRDALVSDRMSNGAVAVVGLSMMATPLLAFAGRKLATRLSLNAAGDHGPTADAAELENHVVIGGCGRVAQMVMQALETENVPYVCLDTNHEAVAAMRRQGRQAYFGDATRAELLEKIGGPQARAFVVTLNRAAGAERMVTAARKVNRSAFIFARAADATHAARLVKRGAFGVIPETVEASIQLTGRLLETLDVPEDTVARRMSEMRDAEIEKLDRAEAGEAV